jgi:acetyl-CoA C-acetyltransferase
MSDDPIVIVGAARTPMGGFQGELGTVPAPQLGATAIKAALERAKIKGEDVSEVLMGNVLAAGLGQAPARQATLGADLPLGTPSTTISKVCGSGMKAVMMAHDQLKAGNGEILVAGGMESMTNAPYLLPKMRGGARMGHAEVIDHMFFDGLQNAYDGHDLMGNFAENCAGKYEFSRESQDEFAISSLNKALAAQKSGAFDAELAPVTVSSRKGDIVVSEDEQPKSARPEKIPTLRPAFAKDGTVTAANASSISDGAAALVLMRESDAKAKGLTIRARIIGHQSHAHEPGWFTTAPVPAMQKLLSKIDWSVGDVDLWEINEAFAVVTMAAEKDLGIDRDKINIHGGACALGHPIGASGARILVTLLHALEHTSKKRGVASLCIGGGEATAMAIEIA